MKGILFYLYFHLILKWLIARNYILREKGILPDEWHWADELAVDHGYYLNPDVRRESLILKYWPGRHRY